MRFGLLLVATLRRRHPQKIHKATRLAIKKPPSMAEPSQLLAEVAGSSDGELGQKGDLMEGTKGRGLSDPWR